MELWHVVVLGIIEGITEFLPISSTGHLILASELLDIRQTEFVKTFEIAIQSGAILSVIVLYWKRLLSEKILLRQTAIAFIPTAVFGAILYKVVKTFFLGNAMLTVIMLFIGGIGIIAAEYYFRRERATKEITELSIGKTALIGVFQALAMVPGVSRSASTIIGGLFMGLSRKASVEFSFILAIPTMLAATTLDLTNTAPSFSGSEIQTLIIGFIVSFIVALIVVKWFLRFVQKYDLIPFGIYRIIVSLLFFLFVL